MARSAVEQIKERLNILDVIGGYVELKRAGKSYKGKSPFTNEKTPSFFVSPERGMYYCFSSQKGGDMFTFIEEMEGVDFKGALKILAERAHVELVPEDPKKRDEREGQYALLEEAAKYFFKARERNKDVQAYIADRGANTQTVHAWRIGYAVDEWRALRSYLKEKGHTDKEMLRAGLIKEAGGGKEPYDVFRDRIMFPIMDSSGRVVAFSGRTLKKEDGVPKYVNSPETELFQKSEILYGYDKAKNGIRNLGFSLIVEGQFDLVLSHQAGYTNTVAVSGTALTRHHIMLLLRLSRNAVLALDADRAGISAIKRSSLPMLESGMDVKVAHMPDGKDPADIVKKDPAAFKKIVGNAQHVVEFLLDVLKAQSKDDRAFKLKVREEVLPLLVGMENRIDREHFEGVIAERLETTKDGVHFEVERLLELAHKSAERLPVKKEEKKTEAPKPNRRQGLEHLLYAFMELCVGERRWVEAEIEKHLTHILGKKGSETLLYEKDTPERQKVVFTLEERLEGMNDRMLIDEVSHALTQYAHVVAKDELNALRKELALAEAEKEEKKTLKLLEKAKKAESLLQVAIAIEKK